MSAVATYQARRDQRIADNHGTDQSLMCAASGCPNRWSVSLGNGRGTCGAHAWAPAEHWPGITQREVDRETERAYAVATQQPAAQHRNPGACPPHLRGRLEAAKRVLAQSQPSRDWAHRLRDREARGDNLTEAQRDAWRKVLQHVEAAE